MPDGARTVIGHEQGAVAALRDAYRPAPDLAVGGDEAGEEVLVFAGGVAVVHGEADDFIAGSLRPVPGAVLGGESVTLELSRELGAPVEEHFKRGEVRVQDDVWGDDPGLQLGMLADVAWVLQAAGRAVKVEPGPAVEAAYLHVGHVVGHQVVAQAVALIGRAPKLAGDGVDGFSHTVANAECVDLDELAGGQELQNVGAMELKGMGVDVIHVGKRSDGGEKFCSVLREDEVAGPVAAAAQMAAAGQFGQRFFRASSFEIAILIGEADNAVGVADVDPLGVRPVGIERNAEWQVEAGGED